MREEAPPGCPGGAVGVVRGVVHPPELGPRPAVGPPRPSLDKLGRMWITRRRGCCSRGVRGATVHAETGRRGSSRARPEGRKRTKLRRAFARVGLIDRTKRRAGPDEEETPTRTRRSSPQPSRRSRWSSTTRRLGVRLGVRLETRPLTSDDEAAWGHTGAGAAVGAVEAAALNHDAGPRRTPCAVGRRNGQSVSVASV